MDVLIMAGQLILGLSILVGLHELGHLLTAKMFGMRVEQFSIGFPPKIFGVKWGETVYSIGAIPLGGFVKISGMIDESMDKEQMAQEPQPWEFRSKPAWQRLIVMMGGIIVNVITGIIIFIGLNFVQGKNYIPKSAADKGIVAHEIAQKIGLKTGDKILKVNGHDYTEFSEIKDSDVLLSSGSFYTVERDGKEITVQIPSSLMEMLIDNKESFIDDIPVTSNYAVEEILAGSEAEKAGLKKGDLIVAINGKEVQYYHEFQQEIKKFIEKKITLTILRDGEKTEKSIMTDKEGKIGFYPAFLTSIYQHRNYTLGESVSEGTAQAFNVIFDNIKGFKKIFKGEISASKSLSGPIGIGKVYGATWIWAKFWAITGMLSMVLAFMNFLPIPALDGGHVVFLTYEMISGRKPSDKFLENAQKVGMVLLLGLMAFAIFNDIFKIAKG